MNYDFFLAPKCRNGWQTKRTDARNGKISIIGNFDSAEECALRVYIEHPNAVGASWWTESAYTCEAIYGDDTLYDPYYPETHHVKSCIFEGITIYNLNSLI